MKRPTPTAFRCAASVLVAVFWLWGHPQAQAQNDTPPPQGTSRGENFSAKPPAALFASDCTGAGCHKGPQGLGKNAGIGGLAGFLREHYTNSRESAAAMANYLTKLPSGPEPREARTPRGGKPTAAAPASGWGEGFGQPSSDAKPEAKPTPREARAPKPGPAGRTSRATDDPAASVPAATPRPPGEIPAAETEKPEAKPSESAAKPPEAAPKPEAKPSARVQRGRHPTAAAASASEPEAAPPASAAAPPPPSQPAAPPAPKEFDIFD